jgi:polyisoprenoid-binding protein YceI
MATTTTSKVPGYVAATWDVDPLHTEVSFSIRHAMISKLRGRFTKLEGVLVTTTDPLHSSGIASIDLGSVATGNDYRDNRIRSAGFLDVANHPVMTWHQRGCAKRASTTSWTRNCPFTA